MGGAGRRGGAAGGRLRSEGAGAVGRPALQGGSGVPLAAPMSGCGTDVVATGSALVPGVGKRDSFLGAAVGHAHPARCGDPVVV